MSGWGVSGLIQCVLITTEPGLRSMWELPFSEGTRNTQVSGKYTLTSIYITCNCYYTTFHRCLHLMTCTDRGLLWKKYTDKWLLLEKRGKILNRMLCLTQESYFINLAVGVLVTKILSRITFNFFNWIRVPALQQLIQLRKLAEQFVDACQMF